MLTAISNPPVPQYIASVTGVVTRINKLITVQSHCRRYSPEVGDVVVGRVTDLVDSRWRLDINGRQLASLMLSSVNLPGAQRRRTEEDALQMRAFLAEGGLVSAEVQKVMTDRSVSLHTRSAKYGKLEQGVLVAVPASLVRRCKQHFHTLEDLGVDMIIGVNGYVWLAPTPSEAALERRRREAEDDSLDRDADRRANSGVGAGIKSAQKAAAAAEGEAAAEGSMGAGGEAAEGGEEADVVARDVRESIARLRMSVLALAAGRRKVHRDSVLAVYNKSVELHKRVVEMTQYDVAVAITQGVGLD